ncbi:MAG: 3-phosphoshikimate 1-carboxyvinyltransferase [Candidatus Bathyarchaeia archaeon]
MKLIVEKTDRIAGEATPPSSKSHTIRALVFASLAEGRSTLWDMLESEDTRAAHDACTALGAEISRNEKGGFEVEGFNGYPNVRKSMINTLNSGTTTNFIASVAALADRRIVIDGDASIRRRPVQPLLSALNNLGARAASINSNGCPPIEVQGRMIGGRTPLDCRSSQYLSSLLISCPLLEMDTEITPMNCCELPYIEMTMRWLDELGIEYENRNLRKILIPGGQKYRGFTRKIPTDWSSATFILVAAAMLGEKVTVKGLDPHDTQADREVLSHLSRMGSDIQVSGDGIVVGRSELHGCELDLNNTPDALPAVSVLGCVAEGVTTIRNVAHARIKETDRIRVMTEELSKMGARIQETEDGMVIEHSKLSGTRLNGHGDHRVVMALSLAGLIAEGITIIETAEAIRATFPNYTEVMRSLGGNMRMEE